MAHYAMLLMPAMIRRKGEDMAMPKNKHNTIAIRESAKEAGIQLSRLTGFSAVEAQAKKVLAAMDKEAGNGDFAEFRFSDAGVQGVVKAGEVTVTINR